MRPRLASLKRPVYFEAAAFQSILTDAAPPTEWISLYLPSGNSSEMRETVGFIDSRKSPARELSGLKAMVGGHSAAVRGRAGVSRGRAQMKRGGDVGGNQGADPE
jgi:hypothetical protein